MSADSTLDERTCDFSGQMPAGSGDNEPLAKAWVRDGHSIKPSFPAIPHAVGEERPLDQT